jgi:L-iditol 2-dehydrogenase
MNHKETDLMMKVARLHGVRDTRLEVLPRPHPGPGQVLLRVAAVGVCGSDVHYYLEGRIGSQVVTEPIILGHEFSAWVAGLGEGVTNLAIGQLVTVEPAISCMECELCLAGHPNLCPQVRFCGTPPIDGVFAEYTLMPAENCFPLSGKWTSAQGALLEPLGIAIHTVDLAHLSPGSTVAVLGAGPIGLLTAAVARVAGAAEIIMTEPLAYRRQFAHVYAADQVLDPEADDVVAQVMEMTGGRGVDVAFECSGAPGTAQEGAAIARPGGKLILCGIPADDTVTLNASTIRRRGLTIKLVRRMKHTYPRAIRLVEQGIVDIKPLITHLLPLERVSEALELVAGYQEGVLRAVIEFERD